MQIRFLCGRYVYFHRREFKEGEIVFYTCDAFPNGIPEEILYDESLHRKHIDGDGGRKFKARKDCLKLFNAGELAPDEIEL